jgi:hypothetical protein
MNDFRPLIDLIESSIAPDSWTSTQGEGTIRPYLSGVYVDAAGALHRYRPDDSGRLNQLLREQPSWKTDASGLRRLSLVELERQCRGYAARNQPIPEELMYLGGIYDLQYLIVDTAGHDLLIAGPAGPWRIDDEGVAVNLSSGRPVLRLDDLVQCLRCVMFEGGRFGCSITPRQENLAATQQFMNTSKLQGQAWRDALQNALGQQDIEVFGIPAASTTAQVLVEADYRMKLIGMGLETTKAPVSSYLDRAMSMVGADARPMDVARWWFTLNYDGIGANPDRTVFEFVGSGVQVMAETEFLNAQGERLHTGQSFGPTREFAGDFTRNFDAIAEEYPIYNQLRNVFDLAIACSVIKREGLADTVGWQPSFFAPASDASAFRYRPQMVNVAREVTSVMNHETKTVRQGQRRVKHTLVGVSGGIECNASDWVNSVRYAPLKREVAAIPDRDARRALLHDE